MSGRLDLTTKAMPNIPKISCIIPVYNGKRDLRRAVDSALAQLPEVQVVLVDDCSTDGSTELVLEMAAGDSRIIALTLPHNRGQGFARNVGVAAAEAEYVAFLDQDDEHLPGWYVYALGLLELNPGIAAVKGDIELIDIPANTGIVRGDARWRAMANSTIWNMVMRKVVYGVLGGCPTSSEYRTREGNEDIELVLALTRDFKVLVSSGVVARHYIKPNGATAYFLQRSSVVGNEIHYAEHTEEERKAALEGSGSDYKTRSSRNVESVRAMLKPPAKGVRLALARLSNRILQTLTHN
jgi:glycosyltransferase involved in cell wall biosynthesis